MARSIIGILTSRSAQRRTHWATVVALTLSVCIVSALHYVTAASWSYAHEIFQRFYYVPVVAAAVAYGTRGGLATGALSVALYLPQAIATARGGTTDQAGQYAEMVMFLSIGFITGWLADAVRAGMDERLRADRLVTIGRLASGIAHEIRTPLGGLLGSLEILGSDVPGDVPKAEFVNIAKSQIERMNHVVADFIDFASPPPPITEEADVAAVVDAAVRLANPTIAVSGGTVHVSAPREVLHVKVDVDQVKRALLNLLLDQRIVHRDVGIVITEDYRKRVARILVVPGEPPRADQDVTDLFEPFPGSDPGAGLALAMTRRLIENQGGRIFANHSPGTFEYVVELPLLVGRRSSERLRRSEAAMNLRHRSGTAVAITATLLAASIASAQSAGVKSAPAGSPLRTDSIARIAHLRASSVVALHTVTADAEGSYLPYGRGQQSLGSGVVIDANGGIITNAHVVAGATIIHVITNDGDEIPATVVGLDADLDVALVQASDARGLRPAPLGNSDTLRAGDWVIAIGNPFGLHHTVTAGIVSAAARSIDDSGVEFLQTDTALSPGNSGGPLLDLSGRVVGINEGMLSPFGQNIGLNVAIPISVVKEVLPQLRTGSVVHGWIGVVTAPLSPRGAAVRGVPGGLLLTGIVRDGPAARAGLRPGDIVTAVNSQPPLPLNEFNRHIRRQLPGSVVQLSVRRDQEDLEVTVGVARRTVPDE